MQMKKFPINLLYKTRVICIKIRVKKEKKIIFEILSHLLSCVANAENQQIAVKLKTYTDFQDN